MIENEVQCHTKACDWMIDGKCHNPSRYADDPVTCIYNTERGRSAYSTAAKERIACLESQIKAIKAAWRQ